ncbi:hypothetical protein FNV43_RR04061 [Rhamnella rubrinervis]|uniref:Uncharacterized protein n=1 Tax=Rhamnella rubrinervis TaxID=2594499 RepID=A0A8K0MQ84_9ROSA|nr:hypothetical protein FNV43_RR04061 [Rhamnella rubrinervis]
MADAVRMERIEKMKERYPNPSRYEKISGLLNHISKFAFDSTFIHSLKSLTGKKQVKKIEHQELRYQPFPDSFNEEKKQDVKLVMEHMQSKMEKMQEDMSNIKQQHKTSAKCVVGTGALEKTSDEGFKGSDLMQNQKKKSLDFGNSTVDYSRVCNCGSLLDVEKAIVAALGFQKTGVAFGF